MVKSVERDMKIAVDRFNREHNKKSGSGLTEMAPYGSAGHNSTINVYIFTFSMNTGSSRKARSLLFNCPCRAKIHLLK